jgi:hypothetical protein
MDLCETRGPRTIHQRQNESCQTKAFAEMAAYIKSLSSHVLCEMNIGRAATKRSQWLGSGHVRGWTRSRRHSSMVSVSGAEGLTFSIRESDSWSAVDSVRLECHRQHENNTLLVIGWMSVASTISGEIILAILLIFFVV